MISCEGSSIKLSGYKESENFGKVGLTVFSLWAIFGGVRGLRLGEYADVEAECCTQLLDLDRSFSLDMLEDFLLLFCILDNDLDRESVKLPSMLSENTKVFVLSFEFFCKKLSLVYIHIKNKYN